MEKKCFGPYWDGHAEVFADPVRVHWRLFEYLDGDPNANFKLMAAPGPTRPAYREKVENAVRKAFDLSPFDRATGEGLNQDDVLDLLDRFVEYQDEKKREWQLDSDLASCYGLWFEPTHEDKYGLMLNLERQRLRTTWAVKEGAELALPGRAPTLHAVRAICDTDVEGEHRWLREMGSLDLSSRRSNPKRPTLGR